MAFIFRAISARFWAPRFWLPGDKTWDDLVSTPELPLPVAGDLWVGIYAAFVLFALRFIFERLVATRVAIAVGIPPRRVLPLPPAPDPWLINVFHSGDPASRRPDAATLKSHAERTNLPPRQVASWFRQYRRAYNSRNKTQLMDKFNESCWRFVYYLSIFVYGVAVLWDKDWFWDTRHCWIGWPEKIPLHESLRWYYMFEFGFYTSLFISQFFDVQRKDFWQMFTHHVATLVLISASWITNMVRIGSLVLVVHDAVDWLLEISKLTNYAKWERLCEVCFVCFASVWFASRLVYFPLVVIRSCLFEATATLEEQGIEAEIDLGGGKGGVYYLFNGLLILLYCLHWFWFYHIMSMAFKLVYYGKVVKDARSESEGSDATDEDDNNENNVSASSSGRPIDDVPLGDAASSASSSASATSLFASNSNGFSSINGISKDAISQHETRQRISDFSAKETPKDK